MHHENGINSAIIEQVIINTYGRKKPISLCNIHGDSVLSSEPVSYTHLRAHETKATLE